MNTSSSLEDDDPLREARAYNHSIYVMVAMPYVLFGAVGFAIYRGIKTAQKKAQASLPREAAEDHGLLPGDPVEPPSPPRAGRE